MAKTAIPSKPSFLAVSLSVPQADLGTDAGVSLAFPPFLWSDAVPPSSLYVRCQIASHWRSEADSQEMAMEWSATGQQLAAILASTCGRDRR